jgi:hypothetical protein
VKDLSGGGVAEKENAGQAQNDVASFVPNGLEKISGVVSYRGNIPDNPDADQWHDSGSLHVGRNSGRGIMGAFDELDVTDRNWFTGYGRFSQDANRCDSGKSKHLSPAQSLGQDPGQPLHPHDRRW